MGLGVIANMFRLCFLLLHGRRAPPYVNFKSCRASLMWQAPINAMNIGYQSCNHIGGVFCVKRRLSGHTLFVHTGTLHGVWRLMKEYVPYTIASMKEHVLLSCVRNWQWRHTNQSQELCHVAGQALALARL